MLQLDSWCITAPADLDHVIMGPWYSEMSASTTILALALYPLLFVLPLNLVRFQWGFRQGPAPMPPEVQERAEAADRVVLLVIYVTLLTVGALLMHGSAISMHAVGLTTTNWKSAMALGALMSYVPLGFSTVLLRNLPTDEQRRELDARGPLATWCGLSVLSSCSVEFWRVLCIAALIRLDLFAWIAVLIVALTYGAPQMTTSTARAVGAAVFGGLAGFLFVKTGSLLAPLTMSLITMGANLYRVRHIPLRVPTRSVTCPVCSASFCPGEVKRTLTSFTCPKCGEVLEYEPPGTGFTMIWGYLCLFGVPILSYLLGYRDFTSILVSIGAAFLILFLVAVIHSFIIPPRAQQKLSYGDSGLHLTDKPRRREEDRRRDDES